MLRSLFTGITGLRSHQTMMDVTGNNIANVNTHGYKSSQTIFQDTLSQIVEGAGLPQNLRGGTNPAQVGLGVQVAAISQTFTQGSLQNTGRSTDVAITGDGFFVVRAGGEESYTRAGAFSFDADGRLVTPEGGIVQGWVAQNGTVDTNRPVQDLALPLGTLLPPAATRTAAFGGNLPGDTTATTPFVSAMTVFDAQGNERQLSASFTRTSGTTWSVEVTDGTSTTAGSLTFAADGSSPNPTALAVGGVTVDLSGLTGFSSTSSLAAVKQDGYGAGALQGFSLGGDGSLTGVFSSGRKVVIGQLALATFTNPGGLEKAGATSFRSTVNSGLAQLGTSGNGGRGTLTGGRLEMSNVDLAAEFTNLIVAQRGFQANSRVITSSDELLQDLVNLKR
jgi:flagellar hook protein FlgE